VIWFIYSFMEH